MKKNITKNLLRSGYRIFRTDKNTSSGYIAQYIDKINSARNKKYTSISKILNYEDKQRLQELYNQIESVDEWRFDDLKRTFAETDEWRFDDLKRTFAEADEWRFDDLKRTFAETDEWRFRDLKNFLIDGVSRDTTFTLEQSMKRIGVLGDSSKLAIAIVSVMPPSETGIANFTARTFAAGSGAIDVYTPIRSGMEYLHQTSRRFRSHNIENIFALDALPYGIDERNYAAIVFVIGNSDHHIPVIRALRELRSFPINVKCVIEIHDSVLLNLCSRVIQFDGGKLSDVLPLHTNKDLTSVDWNRANKGDHSQLVSLGLTGTRALFNDSPADSIIFHSEIARDLVLQDWSDYPESKTKVLFHPVFEEFSERSIDLSSNSNNIHVGSFGVPGRNKETNTIIDAFNELLTTRPGSTLTIAGYGAAEFAASENLVGRPEIIIIDSPPHERLLKLMQQSDIAIQLRARNTGESSGVIPQLLAHDVPTICSAVGALTVFGEAVAYVDPGCTPLELLSMIISEVDAPSKRTKLRKEYVSSHSPRRFCEELRTHVQLLNNTDEQSSNNIVDTSIAPNIFSLEADIYIEEGNFGASWGREDPTPKYWDRFLDIAKETGAIEDPYVRKHLRRYRHTLAAFETLDLPSNGSGLEVGTSWLFAPMMRSVFKMARVDVTDFIPAEQNKICTAKLEINGVNPDYTAFNINLEHDNFPVENEVYDFILCCEVLEHMDIDPMFMLGELNRIAKDGCQLIITTPNVISSRNVSKILSGYAPHFFMQYHKDRSPYRHNLEYAPDQAISLIEGAGFKIDKIWTANTFEPPAKDTENFLMEHNFPTNMRGDNMFIIATKIGPIKERYPPAIYV